MIRRPPRFTLFPSTPLFRSQEGGPQSSGLPWAAPPRGGPDAPRRGTGGVTGPARATAPPCRQRSEEHTSELQSLTNLVCRLLLEKKKKTYTNNDNNDVFTQE